jgi:hypothetical protein
MNNNGITSYWKWLLYGGKKAGFFLIIDKWLFVHAIIALLMIYLLPNTTLKDAGEKVIVPLSGVFVGMTFAWIGNAQAVVNSNGLDALILRSQSSLRDYVYIFLNSALIVLATLIMWGLAALGLHDQKLIIDFKFGIIVWEFFYYLLTSIAVRECWSVIIGMQSLILFSKEAEKLIQKTAKS